MDKRPILNKETSIRDFQDFYWLKEELARFCREEGLKTTGGKLEIAKRIEIYLETGDKQTVLSQPNTAKKSKFDWKSEALTVETKITHDYKNTENTRKFFEKQIGKRFKFNVTFMNWMKLNAGKTLRQAIEEWIRIDVEKKRTTEPKEISPQFEYNRYLRDFLVDNPKQGREKGVELWKIKRAMRGDNIYRKADLKLTESK